MIKQAKEFNRYIAIAGFKNVHINNVDHILNMVRQKTHNAVVQLFNAEVVAGSHHLYFAALNALKAFKNGTNISKNLAVECLLYASAKRQIKSALGLVGIKEGSSQVAVLIVADEKIFAERSLVEISNWIHGKRSDEVLDMSKEKIAHIRRVFNISEVELAAKQEANGEEKALSDLVIEHMALLVTRR